MFNNILNGWPEICEDSRDNQLRHGSTFFNQPEYEQTIFI